jgi:hypothetical protein
MESQMAKKSEQKDVAPRRDFLKLATLGTLLGGASVVTGGKVQAAAEVKTASGYRETDHVKTYYDLARF